MSPAWAVPWTCGGAPVRAGTTGEVAVHVWGVPGSPAYCGTSVTEIVLPTSKSSSA